MTYKQKYKQLTATLCIGFALILTFAVLGKRAIPAYFFFDTVYGEVVEYTVTKERPTFMTVSDRTPQRHDILIEYVLGEQTYWIWENAHVYSRIGIIEVGSSVTIALNPQRPEYGYVMSYALFSTLASLIWPFILLIFIVVTPQWVYAKRKAANE
ncbi:hypothetical protein N9V74_02305 [Alteromonas sp.]|jgi:hypothetical protein|nr:hypothetical protein [Alteromonas sp.]